MIEYLCQPFCQPCGRVVARVYATGDGSVMFAGRVRDANRDTVYAIATGVGKRRHRRDAWLGTEVPVRADGYAQGDPKAWCPDHGEIDLPDHHQLLAAFDKAGTRRVHQRVSPAR